MTAHPGGSVSAAIAVIPGVAGKRPDRHTVTDIRLQRLLRPGRYKPDRGAAKSGQVNAGAG